MSYFWGYSVSWSDSMCVQIFVSYVCLKLLILQNAAFLCKYWEHQSIKIMTSDNWVLSCDWDWDIQNASVSEMKR